MISERRFDTDRIASIKDQVEMRRDRGCCDLELIEKGCDLFGDFVAVRRMPLGDAVSTHNEAVSSMLRETGYRTDEIEGMHNLMLGLSRGESASYCQYGAIISFLDRFAQAASFRQLVY